MIERKCLNCGEPFQVPYPSSKRSNCSEECRIARLRKPDRKPRADTGTRKSIWVKTTCPGCGAVFEVPPWRVEGGAQPYHSKQCFETRGHKGHERNCEKCGKPFRIAFPSYKRRFCFECRRPHGSAQTLTSKGYTLVHLPLEERPPGQEHQRKFMEHRVVMARKIGRHLTPEETVHHINGNPQDNRPENLQLWSSRHPRGAAVEDQLAWAREIISTYEPIEDLIK
jgi:hypothetical protein